MIAVSAAAQHTTNLVHLIPPDQQVRVSPGPGRRILVETVRERSPLQDDWVDVFCSEIIQD